MLRNTIALIAGGMPYERSDVLNSLKNICVVLKKK